MSHQSTCAIYLRALLIKLYRHVKQAPCMEIPRFAELCCPAETVVLLGLRPNIRVVEGISHYPVKVQCGKFHRVVVLV